MLNVEYMESNKIIITLIKINYEINKQLMSVLKPYGISIQQFNVLRILRGQKGVAANLSTVQKLMINKMSNTTRLIDKLNEKSFVKRVICKKNRRKIELYITDSGISFLDVIDPVVCKAEEKMLSSLKYDKREKIISLLKQLNFK